MCPVQKWADSAWCDRGYSSKNGERKRNRGAATRTAVGMRTCHEGECKLRPWLRYVVGKTIEIPAPASATSKPPTVASVTCLSGPMAIRAGD